MRTRSAFLLLALLFPAAALGGPLGYLQTNLVSDGAVPATVVDPDLKNPWGISFSTTSPFWIANNGTGLATLYQGDGTKLSLEVTVPPAPGSPQGTLGTPTGTVSNPTAAAGDFMGDRFLFATQDGVIAGWQGSFGTNAVVRVDSSAAGSSYTGLALAGTRLYGADFGLGRIDIYDASYDPVTIGGAFTDPNLPSGYSPFNIQNLGGILYVAYAQVSGGDEVPGAGLGIVDEFDTNGTLVRRLINPGGPLNAPWGLALAPAGFGELSHLLLVGNFGDGRINAFNPTTGAFVSSLNDTNGTPIENDGLWGLAFGNDANGFDPKKLYFTAGLNDEADGLFGSLQAVGATAVPEPGTLAGICAGLIALVSLRRTADSRRLTSRPPRA